MEYLSLHVVHNMIGLMEDLVLWMVFNPMAHRGKIGKGPLKQKLVM